MEEDFDASEYPIVEGVFKHFAVVGLFDPVFGLLPEGVWDVLLCELGTVVHDSLEDVSNIDSDLPHVGGVPAALGELSFLLFVLHDPDCAFFATVVQILGYLEHILIDG